MKKILKNIIRNAFILICVSSFKFNFQYFSIWTFVAWVAWDKIVLWPLAVAFFGAVLVYYLGLTPAASNLGDLLRPSFDLYRFAVYETLHLPLPSNTNEDEDGKRLSQYLKRGIYPDPKVTFTHAEITKF